MLIVLLAIYNHGDFENCEEIGVCFLAAYLRKKGYRVALIGKHFESVDFDAIIAMNPNMIGMPVYDETRKDVIKSAEILKKALPECILAVGGNTPTYDGRSLLRQSPFIDVVIKGEGEQIFAELAQCVDSKKSYRQTKGILCRTENDSNEIIENPSRELIENINDIPWMARDLLIDNHFTIAQILTSRGCRANCSFCASQLFWKHWRGREIHDVLDEMEYCYNNYNIRIFNFNDGSMEDPSTNCDRLKQLASGLIQRKMNIIYYGHFRAEFCRKADSEVMEMLSQSGLAGVCIGFESGNTEDLKRYNKIATLDDMIMVEKLFLGYGINIEPGFINFNPYSNFTGLRKNADFLQRMQCCRNDIENLTTRYRMYTGTKLYATVARDGLLVDRNDNTYGYRFENPLITPLFDYLYTYIFSSGDRTSLSGLLFYSRRFYTILLYYKRFFAIHGNRKDQQFVDSIIEQYQTIYRSFSDNMFLWYRKLLDIAERGWHANDAEKVSATYFSKKRIRQASADLTTLLFSLKMRIQKMQIRSECGSKIICLL